MIYMDSVNIKLLRSMTDMHAAVELQKVYWGDSADALVPAHMLFSFVNFGGHVLAAMDGDRMVGLLIDFLGTDGTQTDRPAMTNLLIVSKRLVVLPEYRNQNVAYKLKLAQRDIAIRQGIRLVAWTFDPMLAVNAYFNIHKLGVVCSHYYPDYYGIDTSLQNLTGSDRLLADWWVTHRRIEERINGQRSSLSLEQYLSADTPIVNPTQIDRDEGLLWPPESGNWPGGMMALVEIPPDFVDISARNAELATMWRRHIRDVMQHLFAANYIITDFVRGDHEGRDRTFYLLSYNMGFDFGRN